MPLAKPKQKMTEYSYKSIQEIVTERGASYGPPAENHARTAGLWSAYLRARASGSSALALTPDDVCFLNILQKIARSLSDAGPSPDTLLDIAGYAKNIELLRKEKDSR